MALARRTARSNARTEYGDVLRRLAGEIEDDRRTLQQIVAALGFRESKTKEAVAWAGEKVGRLKLNGQIRGYSPLSRVLELEALSVGVAGKLALWESLLTVQEIGERLSRFHLDEPCRASPPAARGDRGVPARAAREAFADGASGADS